MTVLQQPRRPLVVPVVDDLLQQMQVSALWHRLEEVAAHQVASLREPLRRESTPGRRNDMGQVEKDPAEKPAQPDDGEKPTEKPAVEPSPDDPKPELVKPPAAAPRKKITLGSLDAASGHALLATFDSRGAAVERVELTNPKYRDIDETAGYIGHLDLSETPDGLSITRSDGSS